MGLSGLMPALGFYCVADQRYFTGTAALINSLRLVGQDEPIHVLDCGLTGEQRELLRPHANVIPAPFDAPPWLLKTVAPLERPSEVMVLLDADMVATRRLDPLVDEAAAGHLVVFANPVDRHVPEWGELLDLGPMHRVPYVSSAAMLVDRSLGSDVLGLLADRQSKVEFDRSFWRANDTEYPFLYADQDVLNAILSTRVDPDRVLVCEARLSATPPFAGLKVADEVSLRCAYADGAEPYLVHHHVVRPWLEPTYHGVYSQLLRRLLLGDDVAIRLPEDRLPRWLRTGLLAWAERMRINARERFRFHVREPLSGRAHRRGPRRARASR
jgi:hypothetical protein